MTSFADRDGFIWFDGELKPWRECTTHVLTYSLHYGVGCFEGVRAYQTPGGTAIFRLEEHTRRLMNSAKIIGMAMPFTAEQLNEAQKDVLRANKLDSAYLRPMAFYGSEGMGLRATGLKTHVIVAAWEWGAYLGVENMERGIRVKTSSFSRNYVNASMCRAKANANYLNSSMALNEVLKDGYDEALMLDPDGYVAEGSAENIFVVTNGVISTPDVTSALDGITRRTVMTLAEEFGYTVRERRITRDELYCCDEAFFTGTAAEVTPIREVDNRAVGQGSRGPVTAKLQAAYLDAVTGKLPAHKAWLTAI
ncbi:MAG: branched-chain amino acid transaminase [Polycyclovorans sp.]|jgi:branched-chain amino acid aminotransferase|nr:branched-chain amino acid transaminase [Gammaproteobacteria bacterium]MEC8847988.1 branched-chain amino acid transaminase [Pseudomonadota bacterium]|tara:strand:+ start:10522 stop:11445 length:924 start_codon:yes stop_codon:yes gene_type:complete